jgi:putative peptidoglycan lipid II flippase
MARNDGAVTRLMWAAALVTAATVASRLLGFVRDAIIAGFYGQTATVDQYNAAYVIPDTLYLLLIGGAISSAFVPVVSGYLTEGRREEAERVMNLALTLILVGLTPILLLGELFAPDVMRVVAVGFDGHPAAIAHTTFLTRIMLMAVLFHAFNGVLVGIQYAKKSFWATAVGPLFYNLGIIALGWEFGRVWGIQAFAWGVLVGAFANFVIQTLWVWQLGFRYRWEWNPRHQGLLRVGTLMVPVMFGVGLGQLNLIINQTFFASLLPAGSINALRLASRIMMTPVSLAASLAIALLPNLAELVTQGQPDEFARYLTGAMRVVIFVSIPATVGLLLVGRPLVAALFEHGRFSGHAVAVTSGALTFYVLGILAYGGMEVLVRGFYAHNDTKTPVWIGAVALAAGFVMSLVLLHPLRQDGLALAYTLTGYINLGLLAWMLRRRMGRAAGLRMLRTGARTLLATAVMGLGVYMARVLLRPWLQGSNAVGRLAALAVVVAVGTALFALAARRFHVEEYQLIAGRFGRRRLRTP